MKWPVLILILATSVAAQRPARSGAGMSLIPGATFEMGIDAADIPKLQQKFNVKRPELFAEEAPKHKMKLASYLIDKTEVTNLAYKRFVDEHSEWQKDRIETALHNGKYLQHWVNGTYPAEQADYPVVYVTWHAAAAFCRSLGKRLPTEAEWEYAARGGLIGKDFPWGDDVPDKTKANFSASGIGHPIKVASYPPNGYWLYDMVGNVWEFLAD